MNKINKKVLDFYKIMPFNIYGDLTKACENIKYNPIDQIYPFLKENLSKALNIFDEPCRFEISAFRARLPDEKRVIYNWHQDEGTWFLSKKN